MDVAEANYYIFSVSQLGWINCDRFINAEERIDLLANIPVSPDTKLKMAFSEFNGFLKPNIVEGKYVFSKIPKGQEATIVGIKNENGRLLAAFEKIIIGDEVIPDIKFSEVTLSDLKKKLEEI